VPSGGRQLVGAVSPHQQLLTIFEPSVARHIRIDNSTGPGFDGPPSSVDEVVSFLLRKDISLFHCPSDRWIQAGNNYRANMGTGTGIFIRTAEAPYRDPNNGNGAFVHDLQLRARDFQDGLSNTCFFSERLKGDGDPGKYRPWCDGAIVEGDIRSMEDALHACSNAQSEDVPHHSYLGFSWYWGGWFDAWYNHILEPNSEIPDCNAGVATPGGGPGVYSARSRHPGGAHFLYADGSCRLISSAIDRAIYRQLGSRSDGR
jgi:prepilin-type processing-associated H-X9-DG protein